MLAAVLEFRKQNENRSIKRVVQSNDFRLMQKELLRGSTPQIKKSRTTRLITANASAYIHTRGQKVLRISGIYVNALQIQPK